MFAVFYRRLGMHTTRHIVIVWKYIASSTKSEVHNVSQRRQKRTESETSATCTKSWWSSAAPFLSYASGRTNLYTDKHTDILITILRNPTGVKYQ